MFTVSAFKLICRNCPEDLDKLLKLLEVDKSSWELDDEFKIAQELDCKIDKKLCALLDSDSDIDGYFCREPPRRSARTIRIHQQVFSQVSNNFFSNYFSDKKICTVSTVR